MTSCPLQSQNELEVVACRVSHNSIMSPPLRTLIERITAMHLIRDI